jgi:RNase P subunit RPR2
VAECDEREYYRQKWQVYEREYILPCFDLAAKSDIDLPKLIKDNPGKNCVILLVEALQGIIENERDAAKDRLRHATGND